MSRQQCGFLKSLQERRQKQQELQQLLREKQQELDRYEVVQVAVACSLQHCTLTMCCGCESCSRRIVTFNCSTALAGFNRVLQLLLLGS
jgi:hypothetical protein